MYVAPFDPTGGEGEACAPLDKSSMTGDPGAVRQATVTGAGLGERAALLWETRITKAGGDGSIWAIDVSDWDTGRQWSAPAMAISARKGTERREHYQKPSNGQEYESLKANESFYSEERTDMSRHEDGRTSSRQNPFARAASATVGKIIPG